MKKLLALVLTFALVCCFPCALAESSMPTVDEMIAFCDLVLSDALTRTPVSAYPAEDGGYLFEYDEYTIYSPDAALTQSSFITGVALNNPAVLVPDMRGVCVGDPFNNLLLAYPLDNMNLQGTYDEAVLYINGLLPNSVNTGRVLRNGSHALVVEHAVYAMDGEQVEKSCVVYTLENNFVIAVEVLLGVQVLALEDAQSELDALSSLQEEKEYSVYIAEEAEPFMREDLSFGTLDFLTVTPESALAFLGNAQSDTWATGSDMHLRTLQWDGMQMVFSYDASRKNSTLMLMELYGEMLEGPRGLRVGDSVASVLSRFEYSTDNETGLLYGDGQTAPYALYETHDDGSAYVLYAAPVEDGTVLLALTFIDNELVDITCTYL